MVFFSSVFMMCLFSNLVYPLDDSYNHQGFLWIIIILCLWISYSKEAEGAEPSKNIVTRWCPKIIDHASVHGFTVLLILHLAFGLYALKREVVADFSSSLKFARLLQTPAYKNAIVLAEPGYLLESVPYYVDNLLYIYRESRFADYTQFTLKNL